MEYQLYLDNGSCFLQHLTCKQTLALEARIADNCFITEAKLGSHPRPYHCQHYGQSSWHYLKQIQHGFLYTRELLLKTIIILSPKKSFRLANGMLEFVVSNLCPLSFWYPHHSDTGRCLELTRYKLISLQSYPHCFTGSNPLKLCHKSRWRSKPATFQLLSNLYFSAFFHCFTSGIVKMVWWKKKFSAFQQ